MSGKWVWNGAYSQYFYIFLVTYKLVHKVECYITISWKGVSGTSTLAFRATNEWKVGVNGAHSQHFYIFLVTYKWVHKVDCYITLMSGTSTLGAFGVIR
jgi:hypothetical protein